ncbi:MAG TPA: hypothetical protein VFH48_02120 [Chloroflexota bacterium]|nr:hypothetical protein [Chloroflexota bacterium]
MTPASAQATAPTGSATVTPTVRGTPGTPMVTVTPTVTATTTITPTRTMTATLPSSGQATTTPAASPQPFPSPPAIGSPAASPVPGTGQGNAYGARMELVYEEAADGTSVKETIVLHDRPLTNVLTYDLRLDGLKADPQPDGSLNVLDYASQVRFKIPAPTFHDATGKAGAASYRLAAGQLDIVLDPALVSSGVLPFEIDPTLIFVQGTNLHTYASAPWQRQTFTARDGTEAFLYYDPTSGSNGVRLKSSATHFASLQQNDLLISGLGASGFSADIDPQTDTAYVALTFMGASSVSYTRVYALPYNPTTRTWSAGSSVDVFQDSGGPMSAPTVAITYDTSNVGRIWFGYDRLTSSSGTFTYQVSHLPLASFPGSGAWTHETAAIGQPTFPHYASTIATSRGILVVGRDVGGVGPSGPSTGGMLSVERLHNGTWGTRVAFERCLSGQACNFGPEPDTDDGLRGKYYSWVNVPDPSNPSSRTTLVAYAPRNYSTHAPTSVRIYYRVDGETEWRDLVLTDNVDDTYPQLSWDGTSFYAFRRVSSAPTTGRSTGSVGTSRSSEHRWRRSGRPSRIVRGSSKAPLPTGTFAGSRCRVGSAQRCSRSSTSDTARAARTTSPSRSSGSTCLGTGRDGSIASSSCRARE